MKTESDPPKESIPAIKSGSLVSDFFTYIGIIAEAADQIADIPGIPPGTGLILAVVAKLFGTVSRAKDPDPKPIKGIVRQQPDEE